MLQAIFASIVLFLSANFIVEGGEFGNQINNDTNACLYLDGPDPDQDDEETSGVLSSSVSKVLKQNDECLWVIESYNAASSTLLPPSRAPPLNS